MMQKFLLHLKHQEPPPSKFEIKSFQLCLYNPTLTYYLQQDNSHGHYSSLKVAQVHEYSGSLIPASNSRWRIIRDILNAVVLLAGAAYSLQYLFKYLNEILVLICSCLLKISSNILGDL